MTTGKRSRTRSRVLRALAGAVALVAVLAMPAHAQGTTPETLAAAGWNCFQTPPFVVPPRIVCANPGLGRPFPGNPNPPPAYTLPTFDLEGNYLGKEHLIRADLYSRQPCGPSGAPYVRLVLIPYFQCLRI